MDIQKLKGFLAVARYKSFSRAGKQTFRTQPAVTLQIKSLEQELGVRLLDRTGNNNIELTADGRIFYDLALSFVDEADALITKFHDIRKSPRKEDIIVATHNSVMQYLLPNHIAKLKKELPQVKFQFLSRSREQIIDMVTSGEAHLGITSLGAPIAALDYVPIVNYRRLLVAPRTHPLAKKKKISLADLAPYPFILPPLGSNTRTSFDAAFSSSGLRYLLAMEITGRDAIKAYIKLGLGISVMNEYYLPVQEQGNFFVKDVSSIFGSSVRGVLTKRNRFVSQSLHKVLAELQIDQRQSRLF